MKVPDEQGEKINQRGSRRNPHSGGIEGEERPVVPCSPIYKRETVHEMTTPQGMGGTLAATYHRRKTHCDKYGVFQASETSCAGGARTGDPDKNPAKRVTIRLVNRFLKKKTYKYSAVRSVCSQLPFRTLRVVRMDFHVKVEMVDTSVRRHSLVKDRI